jgi:hypothetical protein
MEITIKTICPYCKRDINLNAKYDTDPIDNASKMCNEVLYNLGRNASKAIPVEKDLFFEDLKMLKERKKASENVKAYFRRYENIVKNTKDPKELLRLTRKMVKLKVKVSKNVKKEVEKGKKELLKMIKEKTKLLNR